MEARLSSLHLALAATIDKLSEMYETVQTIQAAYLDDDDLRNLKIKVNSQISWNPQNGSGNEPCFCDPVLPHEFDELFQHKPSVEWPWAEEVEQEFKDENQKHFFEMSARGRKARSSHWDRAEATKVWLSRHLHYSLSNDDDLNFYCHTFWIKTVFDDDDCHLLPYDDCRRFGKYSGCDIYDAEQPYPHRTCILTTATEPDDRLLQSEVLCVVHLMRWKMHSHMSASLIEHNVFPIILFSCAGFKARVVEGHWDGKHLIFRKTSWLDFEHQNTETLKLYLRWMMAFPMGQTKQLQMSILAEANFDDDTIETPDTKDECRPALGEVDPNRMAAKSPSWIRKESSCLSASEPGCVTVVSPSKKIKHRQPLGETDANRIVYASPSKKNEQKPSGEVETDYSKTRSPNSTNGAMKA